MFLGIDIGTGSVKVLLLDASGQVLAEESIKYRVISKKPGWAETNPEDWWSAIVRATNRLPGDLRSEVVSIGFSGQMHGVVLTDSAGKAIRPAILWADTRSTTELKKYERLKPEQLEELANPIATGMAGPSLLWLKKHEPDNYRDATWALQAKDWLRLRLTGVANSEPSDASATLLYDLTKDDWAYSVIEDLGLRSELFPKLIPSTAIAGSLSKQSAESLGLPAGIAVATGAGDAAAAALGSGLTKSGQAQINIGTAMQIFAIRNKAIVNPNFKTHLYRTALDNYYAMAAMQNAGLALEWVRKILQMSWEEMYLEAFDVEAGSEGLAFLPYLSGERTPHLDPNARASWHGLSLSHGRSQMARAAFEGVAFALKDGLNALIDAGIKVNGLRLAGGGSLRKEWRQLLSDVLGQRLYAVSVASASARGAALLAGLAVGEVSNDDNIFELESPLIAEPVDRHGLEPAYIRFKQAYQQIKSSGN